MSSAIDHPRLRALLVELGELSEGDAQLPLPVLTNVNRGSLRIPFRRVVRGVGHTMSLRQYFARFWPELDNGFDDWSQYLDTIAAAHKPEIQQVIKTAQAGLTTAMQRNLLAAGERYWHASSAVVLCYLLSWPGNHLDPIADLLELQLGVAVDTRRMLLELVRNSFEAAALKEAGDHV